MEAIKRSRPFSHRKDPIVPAFDDDGPIVFVDGTCALCSASAQLISRLDRSGAVRICAVQTPLGQATLRHYGLSPDDPESWLFLESGVAYTGADGVIALGRRLGGLASIAQLMRLLPHGWREGLYRFVARNRIRWFGRADLCALPDARLRARLLSGEAP